MHKIAMSHMPARPTVMVWHDHWTTYQNEFRRRGLLDRIEFHGLEMSSVPPSELLASADSLLAPSTIPDGTLATMPRLGWIQTLTVGVDDWLKRRDLRPEVTVVCARGVHRVQMPENILGSLFFAAKPFERARQRQADHSWDNGLVSEPLAGKTLGIVGLGAIGQELARKASLLEMRVLGVNKSGREVAHADRVYRLDELEVVLGQSDYVVLVVPATTETDNLMNTARLKAMKPGAWLMNFARGEVVVDADLIAALRSGHLGGAVLDAFRDEPLPSDHPFWAEERILVLPHMGGKHPQRNAIVADIYAANIERALRHEPWPDAVDRARGY